MFPYEKLIVYQKAKEVNSIIYRLLKENKTIPGYLKNQLGRAALSIQLNIAEGSGRVSERDRKSYLITSRGSTFECAALISFLYELNEVPQQVWKELYQAFEEISRILYSMIKNIGQGSSANDLRRST